ncbi:hypothetical protein LCDV1gp101 [Lymphocystis disease virus 1]|uniref:hypothetical protein n=1 Tax=Fish lymphocystis disease virus TaxID=36363 RepID=UPI0000161EAF|nr:hypothetical protein LCDV1gp101 [Lymphocystis disease virus 1]
MFYFCERYNFKTTQIPYKTTFDLYAKLGFTTYRWPLVPIVTAKRYLINFKPGAIIILPSFIRNNELTILIKKSDCYIIILEVIFFINKYTVVYATKQNDPILEGWITSFTKTIHMIINFITIKHNGFLIPPPTDLVLYKQDIVNNVKVLDATWSKFLSDFGSKYWGYVDFTEIYNHLRHYPDNTAIVYSSTTPYNYDGVLIIELKHRQSNEYRLKIKLIGGIYVAYSLICRRNYWNAESPIPIINDYIKFHGALLAEKPTSLLQNSTILTLTTALIELNELFSQCFWGNIIEHANIVNTLDRDIWQKINHRNLMVVVYHTETLSSEYLFTLFTKDSKYIVLYRCTGFQIQRTGFRDSNGTMFKIMTNLVTIKSLHLLKNYFKPLQKIPPMLQQLCRMYVTNQPIPTGLQDYVNNVDQENYTELKSKRSRVYSITELLQPIPDNIPEYIVIDSITAKQVYFNTVTF